MTDAELIKALGGPTAVARALGVKTQVVGNWSARDTGIPSEHHIPLWAMAQKAGLDWAPPKASGMKLMSITGDAA